MKRVVVVFGGSGFLGSYVADELSDRGYKVIIADINSSKYLRDDQKFVKCDVMNSNNINNILKNNIDTVYNFVAIADIDEANYKVIKTMQINVIGNLNILEACRKHHIKRFVYASSAYAVSKDGSFYGISKHSSEKLIEEYYKRYGLEFTIIRCGSLYGERADKTNYIYNLLRQALKDKVINYKGNGDELREYIHAKDSAKLSVDIIEKDNYINQHIILTGVEKLRRIDLVEMIKEILNNDVEIKQSDEKYSGHYKITPYSFHPTLAKKLVANPFIDLGQGIVDCVREIYEQLQKDKNES